MVIATDMNHHASMWSNEERPKTKQNPKTDQAKKKQKKPKTDQAKKQKKPKKRTPNNRMPNNRTLNNKKLTKEKEKEKGKKAGSTGTVNMLRIEHLYDHPACRKHRVSQNTMDCQLQDSLKVCKQTPGRISILLQAPRRIHQPWQLHRARCQA